MVNFKLLSRDEQIKTLRTAVANALEMADHLGFQMVGINLNEALECLTEDPQATTGIRAVSP